MYLNKSPSNNSKYKNSRSNLSINTSQKRLSPTAISKVQNPHWYKEGKKKLLKDEIKHNADMVHIMNEESLKDETHKTSSVTQDNAENTN